MLLSSRPSSRSGRRHVDVLACGARLGRDHRGREVTWGGGWQGGSLAVVAWSRRCGGGGVGRSSRCCSCSSSTRWLTFSCSSSSSSPGCARPVHRQSAGHFSCAQRGTHSANCAEDCSWRRRPCDQQRQVPAVQRFESSCPRFSSSSEW